MSEIQVSCPARLTLFFNVERCENNKIVFSSCNQLIDLYDVIRLKENKFSSEKGIFISTFDGIPRKNDSDIYKICENFFKYTKVKYERLEIKIDKKIPVDAGLDGKNSDVVGTLLALNSLYNTNLSGGELVDLAKSVNEYSSHFLFGNYTRIMNGEARAFYNSPYYNDYAILLPKRKIENDMYEEIKKHNWEQKEYNNNELYSCLYDLMPDELKRLREYLLQYKDLQHSLSGISNTYFIATHEKRLDNDFLIELNKKFPAFKLILKKNANGYRFLRMYR